MRCVSIAQDMCCSGQTVEDAFIRKGETVFEKSFKNGLLKRSQFNVKQEPV
jgi:hypothetical protein